MFRQFSHSVMSKLFATSWTAACRPPCPSPTPRVYSNSCPLSQWCPPTISSSGVPFSSRFQSFPASGSFQMSQFFASGGQSTGVSASASVLPMNIQDWFPLGWTGWISLQSKGLSRVFFNTTVQKHQFFDAQQTHHEQLIMAEYVNLRMIYLGFSRQQKGLKVNLILVFLTCISIDLLG